MKAIRVLVLLSLLSSGAFAAPAAKYVLSGKGQTHFLAVGRPSAIKIKGDGAGPKGELQLADSKLSGRLVVDLTALKTGIDMRDRHMKEKYLLTNEHPTAALELSGLDLPKVSAKNLPFTGVLEVKGVKKPVSGTYDVDWADQAGQIKARFQINLSDFEVDVPKYAGITVANTVDVDIETPFEKSAIQ